MDKSIWLAIYLVIFIGLLIGSGIIARKWVKETDDFIIAGREIGFLINMLGVVAIGFAGTSITLAPAFSIIYGFKGGMIWGVIYAILGLLAYANIFAKFIRKNGAQTLPEYFEMRYNNKTRRLVSITTVIGLCGILANNVVSLSNIVSGYTGWPAPYIVAVAFFVILIFASLSGMWATTITDFIQVGIGTIAVPIFLFILISKFGFTDFFSSWKSGDWFNQGLAGASMPGLDIKYPSILTFILCFGAALVWGNNYYWIKMSSTRNERVAKNSYSIGALYLIVIFMIPLALIGVFAGTYMPDVFTIVGGKVPPTSAYGLMATTIHPALGALFIVGAAAAALSTSSTSALGATSTATRDIYLGTIKKNADPKEALKASKVIMIFIIVITWIMTFFPGGPVYLFAFANSWLTPPAVLLVLGAFWPKFNSKGALWSVTIGMISMVLITVIDLTGIYPISKITNTAIIGFLITLIVAIIVTLLSKEKENKIERSRDKINDTLIKSILKQLNIGVSSLAGLIDGLNVSSTVIHDTVEILVYKKLISRKSNHGSGFYTLYITQEGKEYIKKDLSEKEKELAAKNLNIMYLDYLKAVDKKDLSEFNKQYKLTSLQASSMIYHLAEKGYIIEGGLFKRKVRLSEKGKNI